jgi:hypothetical protein
MDPLMKKGVAFLCALIYISRQGGSYIKLLHFHLYGLPFPLDHSLQNIPILVTVIPVFSDLNALLFFGKISLSWTLILDYLFCMNQAKEFLLSSYVNLSRLRIV